MGQKDAFSKSSNQPNAETRTRVMPHVQHPNPSSEPGPCGPVLLPGPSHSDPRVHAVSALNVASSRKPDLSGTMDWLGQPKESNHCTSV